MAVIRQLTKLPGDIVRVLVEGKARATLVAFSEDVTDYLLAEVEEMPKPEKLPENEREAIIREIRSVFERYSQCYPKIGKNLIPRIKELEDPELLIDEITNNIPLHYDNKQRVLGEPDLRERFTLLCQILLIEREDARVRAVMNE